MKGIKVFLIFLIGGFLFSCEFNKPVQENTPTPIPITTPTEIPTPVSPISPVSIQQITPDKQQEVNDVLAASIYDYNQTEILCSDQITQVDTAIYSEEVATGTLIVTVFLYDKNGQQMGFQQVPNYATDPEGLKSQREPCSGVYYTLAYTWDQSFELLPGQQYTETIKIRNVISHTTPIYQKINGVDIEVENNELGWYAQIGNDVVYYGPDEEVFHRTFIIPKYQLFLPIIVRK